MTLSFRRLLACALALPAAPCRRRRPRQQGSAGDRLFHRRPARRALDPRPRLLRAGRDRPGAKVSVQSANANEARQIAQLENLIAEGVDALVIVPFNSKVLSNVIAKARKSGIKVIAYDRLILGAPLDAYVSFDNVKVGEMQAQGVVDVVPKGNYYLLGGASTDNNARLFREGQMNVLAAGGQGRHQDRGRAMDAGMGSVQGPGHHRERAERQ